MELDLDQKKILITGASRGIGKAIAEGFLSENANVWLVARGQKELDRTILELKDKFGEEKVFGSSIDCINESDLQELRFKIV